MDFQELLPWFALIVPLIMIAAGFAIKQYKRYKPDASVEHAMLERFATVAVRATEQVFANEASSRKLDEALRMVSVMLAEKGLSVSPEVMRTYIEAAVRDLD